MHKVYLKYLLLLFLSISAIESKSQFSDLDSLKKLANSNNLDNFLEGQEFMNKFNLGVVKADRYYNEKNYALAYRYYHELFLLNPDNDALAYNAACCFGLQGKADSAVLELKLKYKLSKRNVGWTELQDIQKDQDFNRIKESEIWKNFLEELKKMALAQNSSFTWGILFGIMVVLMFFNLFLGLTIKDRAYLYYALLSFVLLHFEAIRTPAFGDYIEHNISNLNYIHWIRYPFPFLVSSLTISYILFVISFLKIKEVLPKSLPVLKSLLLLLSLNCVMSLFYSHHVFAKSFEILTFIIFIYLFNLALQCWLKNNYKPARFFVLASASLTLSSLILLLQRFGIDLYFKLGELRPDNVGVILFMTLLSFALGDKINILTREKAEAQEKALDVLEQKVKERTYELEEKTKIIEEKNQDILASIQYAQRIQKAQLPTEKYLRKIFSKFQKY